MADKKLIAKLKGDINRNDAALETARGARKNALNQAGAPNMSNEERARFRAKYKEFDKKVKELEATAKDLKDKLTVANTNVPEYDTKAGAEKAKVIKDNYAALKSSYDAVTDKNSSDAKSIKEQMDKLAEEYRSAYSESKGAPVSLAVAKADLNAVDLSKVGQSGTAGEKVKTPVEKGAEALNKSTTPKTTAKTPVAGSKTPAPAAKTPTKTPVATVEDVAKKAVEMGYGAIDSVFKTVPELTTMLTKAVTEKWTAARFQSELQNTNWFKSNATNLQQRGFYKRQYNDLVNALPADSADRQAKIDELNQTTTYGRGLASVKRLIQSEAIAEGAVIDDAALNLLAQDIYDHALENDALAIRDYVKANIKYQPGKILSGKAGKDLADLKTTALANGLDLDKAFGGSLQGWLQKLASGESIETYKNLIRQAAKTGMPERIASLLDNGVDLETIYSPYRNLMASTLEINPETINLQDIIKGSTTPKGEMNLYDFQQQLRKDDRWQYTKQARDEVATGVQKVLQDFGFMG